MAERKHELDSAQPTSLIAVSQTFLCFDLESKEDATQQIEIRRIADVKVAWRVRTNAPTRYIVSPNSGTLDAKCPTAKVTVQLVDNNYHPSHEFIVQALQCHHAADHDNEPADVWSGESAKILSRVQTIRLELTTTIVHFDVPARRDVEASKLSLERVLLCDGLSREDKVRELTQMLQMLQSDIADITKNVSNAERLKEMLGKSLIERREELAKLKEVSQQKNHELAELKQRSAKINEGQMCVIS